MSDLKQKYVSRLGPIMVAIKTCNQADWYIRRNWRSNESTTDRLVAMGMHPAEKKCDGKGGRGLSPVNTWGVEIVTGGRKGYSGRSDIGGRWGAWKLGGVSKDWSNDRSFGFNDPKWKVSVSMWNVLENGSWLYCGEWPYCRVVLFWELMWGLGSWVISPPNLKGGRSHFGSRKWYALDCWVWIESWFFGSLLDAEYSSYRGSPYAQGESSSLNTESICREGRGKNAMLAEEGSFYVVTGDTEQWV